MSIGTIIAEAASLSLGYGRKLLTDVTADQFARFAPGTDGRVNSNHPAFIYGHLSLYSPRVVQHFGGDLGDFAPCDKFVEAFAKDAVCVDDPEGTIYPSMDEVTARFFASTEAAIEAVKAASDEDLLKPNDNEAMKARFTTVGSMMGFYLSGHIMIHMGQMSAWRRFMGLGPA